MDCPLVFFLFPLPREFILEPRPGLPPRKPVLVEHPYQLRRLLGAALARGYGVSAKPFQIDGDTVVVDKVVWEIDGPTLAESLRQACTLAERLEPLGGAVLVYSGRRSIHVYLPLQPERLPLAAAEAAYREVAATLARGISYDPHLVSLLHWIRYPNTLHPDTRLYAVPLPPAACSWSPVQVQEYAAVPRCPGEPPEPLESLSSLYSGLDARPPGPRSVGEALEEAGTSASLQALRRAMEELVRPCILRHVAQPEADHFIRTAWAAELCWHGFSREEIEKLASLMGWSDYDPRRTSYHVGKICEKVHASRLLPPSCRTLQVHGYCLGHACPFYPNKHVHWWMAD